MCFGFSKVYIKFYKICDPNKEALIKRLYGNNNFIPIEKPINNSNLFM